MAETETKMTTYLDATNGNKEIELDSTAEKTKWLLAMGYLSIKKPLKRDEDRGREATSVPAKEDPTLAANREAPVPVSQIEPHLANEDADVEGGETTHGKNMGLDAEPVNATGPKVEIKGSKDAGTQA